MKVVRALGLLAVLSGFAGVFLSLHRAEKSGTVVGLFTLATRDVETAGELASTIRRASGLLVGKEVHPEFISTPRFSITPSGQETSLRLLVKQKVGMTENLQSPLFVLIDDAGKEVLRSQVNGLLGPGSSMKSGLSSIGRFPIGTFTPESGRTYTLNAKLDQRIYSALDTVLEVEAKQGGNSGPGRFFEVSLVLLIVGILTGVFTKKNKVAVSA